MKEYAFGDIRVEINEEATRNYYAESAVWDCVCTPCRNFVEVAKQRQLPGDVLALLDKLSIPPEKGTDVEWYETGGKFHYDVIYRAAGHIVNEPEPEEIWVPQARSGFKKFLARLGALLGHPPAGKKIQVPAQLNGKLEGGTPVWCARASGPTNAKSFPEPGFDFGFELWLPWVLNEPYEG